MARKSDKSLTFDLPPHQRAELDAMLKQHGAEQMLMSLIDCDTSPEINERFANDKNSYAFWGPETSTLVRTPDSLYIPLSFDAFKVSGMQEYEFKSNAARAGYIQLLTATTQILDWTKQNNIHEFFLKNSNFSGKHRWPFTCNVNLNHTGPSKLDKIGKILNHIHNINEYAMLAWATPGLGLLARRKLDLAPHFYAFGSTFYNVTNTQTGQRSVLHMGNATKDRMDYIEQERRKHPELEFERFHIGMPITKEVRIFSINGTIQGHVPYWTPVAFKNQSVYGLGDGKTLDDALRDLAYFHPIDIDYLYDQTNKIISHPKFHDTDWAIDWVITRDGIWYMIDMQTARSSYMDVANMQFRDANAKSVVYNFINNQMENMVKSRRQMSMWDRLVLRMRGVSANIDEGMARFGYPTQKQLKQIIRQIGGKTK